jgi:putative transposase
MANTYTQIHLHLVFAVRFRNSLLGKSWKSELFKYITGIVQNLGHKTLAINGVEDHIHILIGLRPAQSISSLVKDIKANSSRWINERRFSPSRFEWQNGFGGFSCSKSELPAIIKYIENQEIHHSKNSFGDEYIQLLKSQEVEYDPRFLFMIPEEN